jgi:hypothetical protein
MDKVQKPSKSVCYTPSSNPIESTWPTCSWQVLWRHKCRLSSYAAVLKHVDCMYLCTHDVTHWYLQLSFTPSQGIKWLHFRKKICHWSLVVSWVRTLVERMRQTSILVKPLQPSGFTCTTCFNTLKLCILATECVCVFRMVLTINSEYFPKQH